MNDAIVAAAFLASCRRFADVFFLKGAFPDDSDHLTDHCVKPLNRAI